MTKLFACHESAHRFSPFRSMDSLALAYCLARHPPMFCCSGMKKRSSAAVVSRSTFPPSNSTNRFGGHKIYRTKMWIQAREVDRGHDAVVGFRR